MATAKLFGCPIIVDADGGGDGGGDSSTAGEDTSMCLCFPPLNQSETDRCLRYLESNSDSGSASMELEPDLSNCFIDFFDRESHGVEIADELSIWRNTDEEIELALGIGSRSALGGNPRLEVTDSGRVEEVNMIVDDGELEWEDLQSVITWFQQPDEEEEEEEDDDDQAWEVLFSESVDMILDSNHLVDLDFLDVDYDSVIGQMFDSTDPGIMGSPPASKTVVDGLPVVELSDGNVVVCAICKDEIAVKEKVKRLPCKHYYHGECIVPWLGIRNTCPVCRFELPTDDIDYERSRKSQMRGGNNGLGSDLMNE